MRKVKEFRAELARGLDGLAWIAIVGVAAIAITGGGRFHTRFGWFEMSELSSWVLVVGLITLLRLTLSQGTDRARVAPPLARAILRLRDSLVNLRKPVRAFWIGLAGVAVIFSVIHIFRHLSLHTHINDMGVIHHVLANTWNRIPYSCDTCPNGTFLADHLAFTLALFAPLAGGLKSDALVFIGQSLIMAYTVSVLTLRGPLNGSRDLCAFALLILLCHPALRNSWYWDFREDHLAFLFLGLGVVGIYRHDRRVVLLATLLTLLTKENMAFILPFTYVAAWVRWSRGARFGNLWKLKESQRDLMYLAVLTLACIAYAGLSFKYLLPRFGAGQASKHEIVSRFPGLGNTPGEVTSALLTRPWVFASLLLSKVFSRTGIRYLIGLFGPWLFFARLKPVWLLAVLPGLLMNLISGADTQRSLQFHYELMFLPFFIVATLEGIRKSSPRQLAIGLFIALLFSGRWPGLQLRDNWPTRADLEVGHWLRHLPSNGILGVNDRLFAQVSLRPDLRLFFVPDSVKQLHAGGGWGHTPARIDSAELWRKFFEGNAVDHTGIPGHSVAEARWILLDQSREAEQLMALFPAPGWRRAGADPRGTAVLIEKAVESPSAVRD